MTEKPGIYLSVKLPNGREFALNRPIYTDEVSVGYIEDYLNYLSRLLVDAIAKEVDDPSPINP